MVIKLHSNCCRFGERRDNDQRFQLQGGGHHLLAEESQIIPISSPNPLDQAMHVKTLDDPRDLGSRFSKQCGTQKAVFKTMDVKLPSHKRLEQLVILFIEEVKVGMDSEHEANEAGWPAAFARRFSPDS